MSKISISILSILAAVILLVGTVIWLWQRQPGIRSNVSQPSPTATASAQVDEKFVLKKPQDGSVTTASNVSFSGKSLPNAYLVITSNSQSVITRCDKGGNFTTDFGLSVGLNLINLEIISSGDWSTIDKSLTLWRGENSAEGSTVYAGLVKSIFDPLVTITSGNTTKNIRTSASTIFDIPKNEKVASESALELIRVGDWATAIGNKPQGTTAEDTIIAQRLQIIRGDKPQNIKKIVLAKVITGPKLLGKVNVFSIKNNKDGNILEMTLAKSSTVLADGKNAAANDIGKDKNSIVTYVVQDDKNVVDLVYILP